MLGRVAGDQKVLSDGEKARLWWHRRTIIMPQGSRIVEQTTIFEPGCDIIVGKQVETTLPAGTKSGVHRLPAPVVLVDFIGFTLVLF